MVRGAWFTAIASAVHFVRVRCDGSRGEVLTHFSHPASPSLKAQEASQLDHRWGLGTAAIARIPIHLLLHAFWGALPPKTCADTSSVGQVLVKIVEKMGSKIVGHSRVPHQ